jgi:hypothetical protein
MENSYFDEILLEIEQLSELQNLLTGVVEEGGQSIDAEIERINNQYFFRLNNSRHLELDAFNFVFSNKRLTLNISGELVSENTKVSINEGWSKRLEGKIYKIENNKWVSSIKALFRSYYHNNHNNLLYNYLGIQPYFLLIIAGESVKLSSENNYIVIESCSVLDYDLLISIGFISGYFIQDHRYTFQYTRDAKSETLAFQYQRLRPGTSSIYQALIWNPFSYKNYIGKNFAEELYASNLLKPLDLQSLTTLTMLSYQNTSIQYALVLFNEANDNNLSLLVKNNCFYAVFEVLKKAFYEIFSNTLPKDYTSKGNIEKYKFIFGKILLITDDEIDTLAKRNVFLHGDIKNLEGQEMVDIMHKQVSLIFRLILNYIGFEGYAIDHYALRNELSEKAFVRIN